MSEKEIEINALEVPPELGRRLSRTLMGHNRRQWRNPAAQEQLTHAYDVAMRKVDEASKKLLTGVIMLDIVNEVQGLKGALSLLKRVTGNDYFPYIVHEDDSEVGLMLHDKFQATGLQAKVDKLTALYEQGSVRLDMVTGWEEAVRIVDGFKHEVTVILAEQPTVIS